MTLWHKPAYTALDRDPATGDLMPGALPPGIYCEDEEAFAKLRTAARLRGSTVRGSALAGMWDLAGQAVFVCTPQQAAFFRATASKAPPPPEPEQSYEEAAAELVRNREREARSLALEMGGGLPSGAPDRGEASLQRGQPSNAPGGRGQGEEAGVSERTLKWQMAVLPFRTPIEQATISLWEAIAGTAAMAGDVPTFFKALFRIQFIKSLALGRYLEDRERQYAEAA